MPPKYRKLVFAFAAVAGLAVVGLIVFATAHTPSSPPLPNPNGYDDFVKAGKAVLGDTSTFLELDQEKLSGLVSSNAEPLRLFRLGLTRQCSFPTDIGLTNFSAMGSELAGLKHLAQLLAAQGRLAEMDGRPAEAASAYIEAI